MVWTVEFDRSAEQQLEKLGSMTQRRIRAYLSELLQMEDPRLRGKGLTGDLGGLWRYRVGDYRLVCQIQNERLVILVVTIGHRSKVYDG